jgi:Mg-chelatase subunit ChlD
MDLEPESKPKRVRPIFWLVLALSACAHLVGVGASLIVAGPPRADGIMLVEHHPVRFVHLRAPSEALRAKGAEGAFGKRDAPKRGGSHLDALLRERGSIHRSFLMGTGGLGGELKGALGGVTGLEIGDAIGMGGLGVRGSGAGGAGRGRGALGAASGESGSIAFDSGGADARGTISGVAPGSSAPLGRALHRARVQIDPMRAGASDDNADFNAFLRFLSSWSDRASTPKEFRPTDVRARTFVHVSAATGEPIAGAAVRVSDPKTHASIWEGVTYGDGTAVFYPRSPMNDEHTLEVAADFEHTTKIGTVERGGEVTIVLDREAPSDTKVPIDVVLLIDTTGSMGDEIARIKETLLVMTEKVNKLEHPIDLRYGAVLYRDHGDDYVTKKLPFTGDVRAFSRALRAIEAGGGGDGPESLNQGFADAVNLDGWRARSAKLIFLIADAPPHLDYPRDEPYWVTMKAAEARGIRVHAVAASGLDSFGSLVFRQIAQYTRGKFIFIQYGATIEASAASHGVASQVESNNLDEILYREIRREVVGWGRGPSLHAEKST